MAGFDEAKFRQLAKDANYSDDEIESYVASQKKNAATGKEFGAASTESVNKEAQALRDAGSPVPGTEAPPAQPSTLQQFFNWVKTPEGTAAASAAGIGVSELVRRKLKSANQAPEAPRVDPMFNEPTMAPPAPAPAQELPKPSFPQAQVQQPAVPGYGQQTMNAPTGVPNVAAPAAPVAPPTGAAPQPVDPIQAARIRKAEAEAAIAEHKLQQLQTGATQKSTGKAPPAAATEPEMQMIQKGGAASVSQRQAAELKAFDANLPKPPEAIQASASPAEKQAAVAAVQETKTGTGKPAFPGAAEPSSRFKSAYGSAAEVPKTHAFVPGAQYIDVPRNEIGQAEYTKFFSQRDFPQSNEEARKLSKEINRSLNRPTREELMAAGKEMPSNTTGITREVAGKKLVKVGGVAGALIALSDLAKAETPEERNRIAGEAIMGAVIPPFMDVGSLNADEQRLLSERFAKEKYAKKVGGGRGVAPPGMYPQGGLDYNSPRIKR